MNIAHLYAAPRTLQISDLSDELATIIWFLRFLHADRKGYFCINAGIADDQAVTGILMLLPNDDHPNITSTRKWFYYDPERPDLLLKAATYALELVSQQQRSIVLSKFYVIEAISQFTRPQIDGEAGLKCLHPTLEEVLSKILGSVLSKMPTCHPIQKHPCRATQCQKWRFWQMYA